MTYQIVNPYDCKVSRTDETFSDVEVERAISIAQASFAAWKSMDYLARASIVSRTTAIVHSHGDEYAQLRTVEMAKLTGAAGAIDDRGRARSWSAKPSSHAPATCRTLPDDASKQPGSRNVMTSAHPGCRAAMSAIY